VIGSPKPEDGRLLPAIGIASQTTVDLDGDNDASRPEELRVSDRHVQARATR
jgi:hypothetical protein